MTRRRHEFHVESEAVLSLMSAPVGKVEFIRSAALDLENEHNPVLHRAAKVGEWLRALPVPDIPEDPVQARTAELMQLGFRNFDAFHLASAEHANVEAFCTCDDGLLNRAIRHAGCLKVRVINPTELVREILS